MSLQTEVSISVLGDYRHLTENPLPLNFQFALGNLKMERFMNDAAVSP